MILTSKSFEAALKQLQEYIDKKDARAVTKATELIVYRSIVLDNKYCTYDQAYNALLAALGSSSIYNYRDIASLIQSIQL